MMPAAKSVWAASSTVTTPATITVSVVNAPFQLPDRTYFNRLMIVMTSVTIASTGTNSIIPPGCRIGPVCHPDGLLVHGVGGLDAEPLPHHVTFSVVF